jgi:hypothetical protein
MLVTPEDDAEEDDDTQEVPDVLEDPVHYFDHVEALHLMD